MKYIKKLIPRCLHEPLRISFRKVKLIESVVGDYKRYNKSAIDHNDKKTKENLRAKITLHYHSLEKGLSNTNIRLGFGKTAILELFNSLEEFQKFESYVTDERYKTAVSVLNTYIKYHEEKDYDVSELKRKYNKIVVGDVDDLGGVYELNKTDVLSSSKESFEVFASSRVSTRCYSMKPVDLSLVEKAINISMKTPSVCNRQPWKIYIIKNKEILSSVLQAQSGIKGSGDNLETLLIITSDNQYLRDYTERNQGYIDGGMFAMSMLYSLHYVGLATCALNADLPRKIDEHIRKIVTIPDSENLIVFIAVGNYPDIFKVPKSHRDCINDITKYRL